MEYISIGTWRDLTTGHLYHEGDRFPFDGGDVDAERITELETGRNRAGLRLITAVHTEVEREDVRNEEAPEQAQKAEKTASARKRSTKRTTK